MRVIYRTLGLKTLSTEPLVIPTTWSVLRWITCQSKHLIRRHDTAYSKCRGRIGDRIDLAYPFPKSLPRLNKSAIWQYNDSVNGWHRAPEPGRLLNLLDVLNQ